MQFHRLLALIGVLLGLAISLTLPAAAQKTKKLVPGKTSKFTIDSSKAKPKRGLQAPVFAPHVTACPTKTPINSGQVINGTLAGGDCTLQDGTFYDEYTFSGTAGQQVSVSMSSTTPQFDPYLFLLKPSETVVDFDNSIQDDDGGGGFNARIPPGSGLLTLPETGTYSIIANVFPNQTNPAETGAYSVTFSFGSGTSCPPTPTPIADGQTINGTLVDGDCSLSDNSRFDLYSFSATAGQQVSITMTGTAPVDPYLILVAPDGDPIAEDNDGGGGTTARIPPVAGAFGTLPATGTYTIFANSNLANQFGSYSITLNFSGASCLSTPIALGQTINGTLQAGDCRLPIDGSFLDVYTFNGTAGQQIAIAQASTALDSFLVLLSPSGSAIAGDDDSGGAPNARIPGPTGGFTLPTTGQYTIYANTFEGETGPYSLTLSQSNVASTIALTFNAYAAGEGDGTVNVGLTRTGDITLAASVNFATSDTAGLNNCSVVNGVASARCDYITTVGTANFTAGQTTRNISIPLVDDSYAEGMEAFTITLSNPSGATLGSPNTATVTINDNDGADGPNPIDGTPFFVRQQYLDFLNREPDPAGFAGWQAILNGCAPGDTNCDRIHVSSAFFRSPEFSERGYFIYRFYPVAFGRKPAYPEFIPDMAKVSGFLTNAELEAARVAFVAEFITRPEFTAKYNSLTNAQYVDTLLATAGITSSMRDSWVNALNGGTKSRAVVLREIAETTAVYDKFFNEAFVVMQYFGYLRREPDAQYLVWITHLNATNDFRSMINGFMNSPEYRIRFGPL
ncbi:MAG TPA: pre-peptidase C-terminal domain-containing protein [Pyrinomonadaceae bacterium]|nr:pre-peptidase C-terminal domain-containing protein [Pyrinomonadaceae bacterium]